jgi:hypothetical protein
MRRLATFFAIALIAMTGQAYAPPDGGITGGDREGSADGTHIDAGSTHGGEITIVVTQGQGQGTGSPGGGGGSSNPDDPYIRVPLRLGTNPDTGRACVVHGWVRRSEYVATDDLALAQAFTTLPACPVDPGPDPEEVATEEVLQFVRTVQLPIPAPTVPPGRALAGLAAHLDAGTDLGVQIEADLAGGHLVLDAASTLEVDWGDGLVEGPLATTGGPWPDGDVVHVYESVGDVPITVTQTWSVTWTYAGFTGTIATLDGAPIQTEATILLPVDEVQAVVH